MEPGDHFHFARDAGEAIRLASRGDLSVPVPACPGYDLRRLVVHCGYFCRFVTRGVTAGRRPEFDSAEHREHEPAEWFSTGFDDLMTMLADLDPEAETWTWGQERRGRFWLRRAAQELSVHRWDADDAVGDADPPDPLLAADGIDELLDEFAPARELAAKYAGSGETLHFHATDLDAGEWLVTAHPDRLEITREHAKGDVAARGSASDLFLFLWGRVPAERLEVFGDASLLHRWQERVEI